MIKVEIIWSVIVFFFKAAHIPNAIPIGTEKTTEKMLSNIDTLILSPIITVAATLASIFTDVPQSHLVNMFLSQLKNCWNTGTW